MRQTSSETVTPLCLAQAYLDIFFGGREFDRLQDLCASDLHFEGPFHRSHSLEAYLQALRDDPPTECSYRMLDRFENDEGACLVYQFDKPGVSVAMCQWFRVTAGRIREIRLFFDPHPFRNQGTGR